MRDSNSRHPRCKRGALPTELITRAAPDTASTGAVARGTSGIGWRQAIPMSLPPPCAAPIREPTLRTTHLDPAADCRIKGRTGGRTLPTAPRDHDAKVVYSNDIFSVNRNAARAQDDAGSTALKRPPEPDPRRIPSPPPSSGRSPRACGRSAARGCRRCGPRSRGCRRSPHSTCPGRSTRAPRARAP